MSQRMYVTYFDPETGRVERFRTNCRCPERVSPAGVVIYCPRCAAEDRAATRRRFRECAAVVGFVLLVVAISLWPIALALYLGGR